MAPIVPTKYDIVSTTGESVRGILRNVSGKAKLHQFLLYGGMVSNAILDKL